MRIKRPLPALTAVGLLLVAVGWPRTPHAQREFRLDLFGTAAPKIKIAIPEPESATVPAGDRAVLASAMSVLRTDLQMSDLFEVTKTATDSCTVQAVCVAVAAGAGVELRATLASLPGKNLIGTRSSHFEEATSRRAMHQLADEIVFLITGEAGIASTRLAYVATSARRKEVWIADADGAGARRLTGENTLVLSPAWIGAANVGYSAYRPGGASICAMGANGRGRRVVVGGSGLHYGATWSADGTKLAYVRTANGVSDIYLAAADGSGAEALARRSTRIINASPCFSPDGRQLAFTSDRSGRPHIWMRDLASGQDTRVTLLGDYNDSPSFSPKGDYLAYATRRGGQFRIGVIRLFDGEATVISRGPGSDEDPCFAPDGRHIAFSSSRSGQREVYTMLLDGSAVRQVTSGKGEKYSPAWSPRDAAFALGTAK